jgi:hypothetical protein
VREAVWCSGSVPYFGLGGGRSLVGLSGPKGHVGRLAAGLIVLKARGNSFRK